MSRLISFVLADSSCEPREELQNEKFFLLELANTNGINSDINLAFTLFEIENSMFLLVHFSFKFNITFSSTFRQIYVPAVLDIYCIDLFTICYDPHTRDAERIEISVWSSYIFENCYIWHGKTTVPRKEQSHFPLTK